MTTTDLQGVNRIIAAVDDVMASLIDSDSFGPEEDEDDEYPRDEYGKQWYHDYWELRNAAGDLVLQKNLYNHAAQMRQCLLDLCAWAKHLGGWEAPCWDKAEELLLATLQGGAA